MEIKEIYYGQKDESYAFSWFSHIDIARRRGDDCNKFQEASLFYHSVGIHFMEHAQNNAANRRKETVK